jgi:hypothetical protein
MSSADRPGRREIVVLVAAGVLLATFLVGLSLRRSPPPGYPLTPPVPREAGDSLVGPIVYTIDARAPDEWRYFDFSRSSVVERPDPRGWDLAVRRFRIIANGGPRFAGEGAILDLGDVAFDAVTQVPDTGYVATAIVRRDSVNAAIEDWYEYNFLTHVLEPKPRVYAVRTADGRYAKVAILSYYCPGAMPGCLTLRYAYQGSGGRRFN